MDGYGLAEERRGTMAIRFLYSVGSRIGDVLGAFSYVFYLYIERGIRTILLPYLF